jgi:hypothetical protein
MKAYVGNSFCAGVLREERGPRLRDRYFEILFGRARAVDCCRASCVRLVVLRWHNGAGPRRGQGCDIRARSAERRGWRFACRKRHRSRCSARRRPPGRRWKRSRAEQKRPLSRKIKFCFVSDNTVDGRAPGAAGERTRRAEFGVDLGRLSVQELLWTLVEHLHHMYLCRQRWRSRVGLLVRWSQHSIGRPFDGFRCNLLHACPCVGL